MTGPVVSDPGVGPGVGPVDVLVFLAEVGVLVAVGWWGATRGVAVPARVVLAVGLVTAFAVAWGSWASPKATWPLTGAASVAFRVAWFGLGAAAALAVLLRA